MLNLILPLSDYTKINQTCSQRAQIDKTTKMFIFCTLLTVVTLPLLLIVNQFDQRLLDGMPIWHKPLRFALSLMLHFLTLSILMKLVIPTMREAKRLKWVANAAALSLWFELSYIMIQAAKGRRSHFNFETQLESALYGLMGVGAFCLVLSSFILGIMIWRFGNKEYSGLRYGAIIGLTVGSILTLIFAGFMSGNVTYIEQKLTLEASVIPYLGWSKVTGDYKPAHFVATHMMQFLPLIGAWLDKSKLGNKLSQKIGKRQAIMLFTLMFTALAFALFIQAFYGIPLIKE